jgi:hypothetical protein
LWSKVWNDNERETYVQNVSAHFKNVKIPHVKERQRKAVFSSFCYLFFLKKYFVVAVWAAVDQGLSDRIAAAIGHPAVKPLEVKPASEADKYRFVYEKLFWFAKKKIDILYFVDGKLLNKVLSSSRVRWNRRQERKNLYKYRCKN